MKILIDFTHSRGVTESVTLENGEQWILKGECNRCGQCCEEVNMFIEEFKTDCGKCNKLFYETVDGKRVSACSILWSRPAGCLIYSRDPYEALPEKCSFEWEKIDG